MSLTPSAIYGQSIDKQRIAIAGRSQSFIFDVVTFTLKKFNQQFDFVLGDENRVTNAPILVWQMGDVNAHSLDFQHHILLISPVSPSYEEVFWQEKLADATPKGGIIIYDATDPQAKKIGSKGRSDLQSIPYEIFKHERVNNQTILVSSTNEKFTVPFSTPEELKCLSATRELLKKIGISSSQFYQAMITFKK